MKTTTPLRIRIRRFITDRYAYRTQPDYLPELILFGIIALIAVGPAYFVATALTAFWR